mgnify:CR=1 FL=1
MKLTDIFAKDIQRPIQGVIMADDAASLVDHLRARRGFEVDISHLTVVGRCRSCVTDD